jgi:hypothetical protein
VKFTRQPLHFGEQPLPIATDEQITVANANVALDEADAADNGEDLPTPFQLKTKVRRMAGIAEAKVVLVHLPGPGESLHAVATARMDMTDVIEALGQHFACGAVLRIATLGYNERNLAAMIAWLDCKASTSVTLLTSLYFRGFKCALWEETLKQFAERGQAVAACHSHAKVITLAFESGERLSIEGSANLCGNGSGREQFSLVNDAGLHDWHAAWIEQQVAKNSPLESVRKAKEAERRAAKRTATVQHAAT